MFICLKIMVFWGGGGFSILKPNPYRVVGLPQFQGIAKKIRIPVNAANLDYLDTSSLCNCYSLK